MKYEYNDYGERITMRTYRTAQSDGDLTQWTPDPATGVLTAKTDALGRVTHYTYDSAGRLKTRVWARPGTITTTYGHNAFGDLLSTTYSDGVTPNVGIVPDRLGRPYKITDASGTRTLSYHPVTGALDLISYDGTGLLPITELNYDWDTALRPAGYTVSGGGPSAEVGYDHEGRLKTVSSAGFIHTHGYIPGTGTLSDLTTTEGNSTVLTRTLYHDRMQRLRGIETKNGAGTVLSRHGYVLDGAGRRERATRENGQRWDYLYDTLGQVTDAVKKFPDGTAMPGHTFAFSYDNIGNRLTATHGGSGDVNTGTGVTYVPNAVNQYESITTQGGRFILGEAPLADAVTVNGVALTSADRTGGLGFFWKQLGGTNTTSPLWSNDTVASNATTISGRTWTPRATVDLTTAYDEDGNLKSDGRWDCLWDADNRLTSMTTSTAAANVGVPRQRLEFVYDSQGRRVSKTVFTTPPDGTTWTFASSRRFLYDGWNLIAEYSAPDATSTSLTLQATHTWGIDLSGTPQGAGGVGGLISSNLISQSPISNVPYFPAYDGNGNITAWSDASGTLLARMDYSPFGQLIALYKFTGGAALARLNFGFSTKFTDAESGLLYYGYRYYDPVAGRWMSRDPLEEEGGLNLYGFVANDSLNSTDSLGLEFSAKYSVVRSDENWDAENWSHWFTAKLALSLKSVVEDVEKKSREKCDCVRTLTIYAHGTNGSLAFSGDKDAPMFNEDYKTQIKVNKTLGAKKAEKHYNSENANDLDDALNNLIWADILEGIPDLFKRMGAVICKGGKIRFIACDQLGADATDFNGRLTGRNLERLLTVLAGGVTVEVDGVGTITPEPWGKGWRTTK